VERLQQSVDALGAKLQEKPAPAAHPLSALEVLGAKLSEVSQSLTEALAETPKASDFQPLADHMYQLALSAPQLQAALEEAPKVAEPIQASVRALQELSDMLHFTQERFAET